MISLLGLKNVLLDTTLAVIPVVLSYAIIWLSKPHQLRSLRIAIACMLGVVWLVFLPNSCYLVTEWRHFFYQVDATNLFLRAQHDKFMFLQFILLGITYFLFSGFGLLTFTLAIRPIEKMAANRGVTIWTWGVPFFSALSLGVYLGLVMRFNSWDSLMHPRRLLVTIAAIGDHPLLVILILLFGLFLWAVYEAIDVWIDALAERWSEATGRRVHLGPNWE